MTEETHTAQTLTHAQLALRLQNIGAEICDVRELAIGARILARRAGENFHPADACPEEFAVIDRLGDLIADRLEELDILTGQLAGEIHRTGHAIRPGPAPTGPATGTGIHS